MLAHRSVCRSRSRPIFVNEESCCLGAVLPLCMASSHMQPLTQQVPGRLDLGCLASARGIEAGDFPWEVIYASSAGVWWANVEGLKGDAVYPGLVGSWAGGGGAVLLVLLWLELFLSHALQCSSLKAA